MKKEKLIFIYPKLFTFIKTEIRLLSSDFDLIIKENNWTNKFLLPFNLVSQFFFLLFNVGKADVILVSFGGYWSYLPSLFGRIFKKRVAIVVHGTDCVSFPEISYGNLRNPLMRWFSKKSYQLTDILLPVSESLVYTENNYYCDQTLKFGYTQHLGNIKTPYKVIPNGLIVEDWNLENTCKNKNTFITVMTNDQVRRKGADLILEVSKEFPDCIFYIAGSTMIYGVKVLPENVKCLGQLTPSELKEYYSSTQFYLQLSNFEGFGVAICEAMLCKCVPIVSDVNFLPSIVGDSGFVLKKRKKELLVELFKTALLSDTDRLGTLAREKIHQEFPVTKRKEMLISVLKK